MQGTETSNLSGASPESSLRPGQCFPGPASGQLQHDPSLRLSLLLQENLWAMAWDFSSPPRPVWARQPERSVYACLGMEIAC